MIQALKKSTQSAVFLGDKRKNVIYEIFGEEDVDMKKDEG